MKIAENYDEIYNLLSEKLSEKHKLLLIVSLKI